jgi:hypothetical protein
MAKIARRKISAITGAVTKLMGKLSRSQREDVERKEAPKGMPSCRDFGGADIRQDTSKFRKPTDSIDGTKIGMLKGKRTARSSLRISYRRSGEAQG